MRISSTFNVEALRMSREPKHVPVGSADQAHRALDNQLAFTTVTYNITTMTTLRTVKQ